MGTHKGCPYNGMNRPVMGVRTIVGASLVGALRTPYLSGIGHKGCPVRGGGGGLHSCLASMLHGMILNNTLVVVAQWS